MEKSVFLYFSRCLILIFFYQAESQAESFSKNNAKSIFESNLIVPHILPTAPKEICPVIYKPGLIIVPGETYFPYQIQGLPDISWDYESGKYYTVVVLGALDKEPENNQNSTKFEDQKDDEVIPPEHPWHQWVLVNVRKNNFDSGTTLQPFAEIFQPNGTHNVVYVFAVYEQFKKFDLNLNDNENSVQKLLQLHFTPMTNFTKSFAGSTLIAGNCFYVVPKHDGILRDSSPVRYDLKREMLSIMKPDHYVGI